MTLLPPSILLQAYANGSFPMAIPSGQIIWPNPTKRGIIPLPSDTHWINKLPHGIRRDLRRFNWRITCNLSFQKVLLACANRPETWISPTIANSYLILHKLGFAHSVEVWLNDQLAGGLYGVHIGAAFFGESMFHSVSGASKVALVALIHSLAQSNFLLLDTQWLTPHLALFGAIEIPRRKYLQLLHSALSQHTHFPLHAIQNFIPNLNPLPSQT
ncbi:MAG: leucyl/phenylalanyl-tRNA--protein transferase [Chthoniobacterales bacterium]|nr:leucyl/phenylalanyl-tRNA--protein transferase [Chthoniobacterales bacterium]